MIIKIPVNKNKFKESNESNFKLYRYCGPIRLNEFGNIITIHDSYSFETKAVSFDQAENNLRFAISTELQRPITRDNFIINDSRLYEVPIDASIHKCSVCGTKLDPLGKCHKCDDFD